MNNRDWKSIEYLKAGGEREQACFHLLNKTGIFDCLKQYHPILTGTIPIGIDISGSDLDIICEVYDYIAFRNKVRQFYSNYDRFTDRLDDNRYVAGFFCDGQEIEIFATSQPTEKQPAYRHMLVEYRLIQLLDESFRQEIIRLKLEGFRTEPAFGKLLNLKEDPYQALFELETLPDDDLLEKIEYSGFTANFEPK